MKKIIQVLGPSGVGKTEISMKIARDFNGEIISADSIQVYKGFDIGSAKISENEKSGIKHYLIDIIDNCEQFNASKFLELSYKFSEKIVKKKKIPVVCGGTALYLRTMIKGIFEEKDSDMDYRMILKSLIEIKGNEFLWKKLHEIDSLYANKVGKNDKKRIIRGLEIYYKNKLPPSEIFKLTRTPFNDYEFIRIGLNLDRKELYERINKRVDLMVEKGLVNEVKKLLIHYDRSCPPFSSIGYKEVLMYLDNEIDFEEMVELIKKNSRNFAKRQLSWFGNEEGILWFTPYEYEKIRIVLEKKLWKEQ